MPRLTGARELVRLVREPHHHRRDFPELERAEHFLAARARRRSVIGLTQNKHHRRLHILDISDGRARFEILFLIERRPFEPGRLKQGEVRCVPPMRPARDVALRYCRREASGMSDHPVRQQPAAAAASDAEFFVVDVTALDHFIDAGHQIFKIIARIMVLNHVAEILAVGCAPARIWKEHYVTLRRHPLEFVLEDVAVSRVRSAMNIKNERIFFRRTKIWRLLDPRLNCFSIETLVGNFFGFCEIEFREKLFVDVTQLSRLRVG